MEILISTEYHPYDHSYSDFDYWVTTGNPKPTGRWKMKGNLLWIEFEFTKKRWFRKPKIITCFITEFGIDFQEDTIYFNCSN